LKKIGQRRLVAAQDAELEEGGPAAADLGQADQLGCTDGDLVGRQRAITGSQDDARDRVVTGFEVGDVFSGLVYVYSPRISRAQGP